MRIPKDLISPALARSLAEAQRSAKAFQWPHRLRESLKQTNGVAQQFQATNANWPLADLKRVTGPISPPMANLARFIEQSPVRRMLKEVVAPAHFAANTLMSPAIATCLQQTRTAFAALQLPTLNSAFTFHHQTAEALAGFVPRLVAVAEAILRHQRPIAAFLESEREFLDLVKDRSKKMAERGWSLPASISISELLRLLKVPDEDLDDAFRELYERDDGLEADALWAELLASDALAGERDYLFELRPSFEAGRYRVVGRGLYTVFEATMRAVLQFNDVYQGRLRRARFEDLMSRPETLGDVDVALLVSSAAFSDLLYAHYRPGEPPPPRLNRHFALHGAGARETKLDCLRLLQGCSTFLWLEKVLRPETEPGNQEGLLEP